MKKFSLLIFVLMVYVSLGFSDYMTLRHFVVSGDTILQVSEMYKVKPNILIDWNQCAQDGKIDSGDILKIVFPAGIVYRVNSGDTLSIITRYFFSDTYSISIANSLSAPYYLKTGQELFIPLNYIGKTFYSESGKYLWPVYGEISSEYGWRTHPVTGKDNFHSGVDIAAPEGVPVFAADSGTVSIAGQNGDYGLMVEIKGSQNYFRYGHLSKIDVYKGLYVEKGDIIGRIGTTGVSTGPHLHFEVRDKNNEKTLDPIKYLPQQQKAYNQK